MAQIIYKHKEFKATEALKKGIISFGKGSILLSKPEDVENYVALAVPSVDQATWTKEMFNEEADKTS